MHVRRGDFEARIWLNDPTVAMNFGFGSKELGAIIAIAQEHRESLKAVRNDHFNR
ncbi:MAG: DUF4160 domain-containing protein [Hyphomicrobiales bacterium]|nr:DUF4160 domain-containing protein [Hyphomicrobiales bacterium]